MKTFLGLTLLATGLCAATLAGAQDPTAPFPPAQRPQALQRARLAIIGQKLELTDAQKAQVKQIRATAWEAAKAIRANPALTPEQKREQVAATWKNSREQWRALLTPEQQARLAEITSHPGQLNAQAANRLRMGMIANRLGLTPEQRAKLREIQKKTAAAVKPIRTDATLTPEKRHAEVRAVLDASRTEARAVLTPEQQAKLDEIRGRLLGPLSLL